MRAKAEAGLRRFRELSDRFGAYLPVVFFLGGVLWDSLTLTRIDRLLDNMIFLAYFLLLGALIVLSNLTEAERVSSSFLKRYARFYPLGIQFFLGGLFSGYLVFYFQSSSFTRTSLFLVILALLLVANEFLHNRLRNIYLQTALFFLAGFSFFVFFIPVVTRVMNYATFLAGGLLGALASLGTLWVMRRKGFDFGRGGFLKLSGLILGLFIIMNTFYLMNWIPPVPLSLKSGGIYRGVTREGDYYLVRYAKPPWYAFRTDDGDIFSYRPGDAVYCFTSVFAPAKLEKKIYHHWQRYVEAKDKWITTDRLVYEIRGGRGKGYRGYTYKEKVSPGNWRVEVRTVDNLLLGVVEFEVVDAAGREIKTLEKRL